MVKRWEIENTCVQGGEQALQAWEEGRRAGRPYQLILTDVRMPKMDGFALVEEIRRRSEMEMMAIVMLTSGAHGGDAERCRALGNARYLFKPIRKTELVSAILEVLGQKRASLTPPRISPPKPASSSHLNILLAEDNHVNQVVARRILEKMGHSVTIANNGAEAMTLLAERTFDLLLMDIQMPQLDGLAATQRIRARETHTHSRLPIIAMTAHAMKGDRERYLQAGMDGYVSKPITAAELESAVASAMHWQLGI
jgi:CheY-like chemotaxis protein